MKKLVIAMAIVTFTTIVSAQNSPIRLTVDASEKIATASKLFNGTNIEDINNQTNGGVFSQLLHGEAFEENIETDFLNLDKADYSKIYVMLDERRIPHLITQSNVYNRLNWNSLTEKYDFNSKDVYNANPFQHPHVISGYRFPTRFMVFDSIPENIQKIMLERVNGNEQISKFWSKLTSGSAQYDYKLIRDGKAYTGRQTQGITFTNGTGEVGITNHGLYRMGIHFESGKTYDGILRIKAEKPTTVYVSLRDEQGKVLAEKPYHIKGDGTYEKMEFELTPKSEALEGSFGISLKSAGHIELGYAFLQPGEWGRVKGYPLRKTFIDALKKQGIKAIRYNGSMVDVGADTYNYRWKKMIGPIDERRVTYRSGFSPYATHSFAFVEMLQLAEAIDAECIIGMSMDETSEDIRDFVEYVNGPITSKWGALRAKHDHPEPYNLKYIQVDNERIISPGYVECVKKFALAAWESDPEMTIMTSLNIGTDLKNYARGTKQYELSSEMVKWFIDQEKGDNIAWDPHYGGWLGFANDPGYTHEMGIDLQEELAKDYPGFWLSLHPMEENGSRCDWNRGLAHAHNWNKNQRYGDHFEMLGTANTFQPHGLHYMWDQGRIHYNSHNIWFQPSAYIDEAMITNWLPNVIKTTSNNEKLVDITAKIDDSGKTLSLYIVNLSDQPEETIINIDNFKYKSKADIWTIGGCDLEDENTDKEMFKVVPKTSQIKLSKNDTKYTLPKYSYTIISLTK
ncbi:alpha-L-arabinofuranosidase C-terminal domain-containing protein [Sunxiuqinia sp. A32]|uniref:alpha-L-arabinofuranosidase C-terminal domain-containing protein n=1 Tax=Sunxiuqinia sp. A32 TaxID=3461496 RepID=UPI0040455FC3